MELQYWFHPMFVYLAACRPLSAKTWVNAAVFSTPSAVLFYMGLPEGEPLLDVVSVVVFLAFFYLLVTLGVWAKEKFEK